MGFAVLLLSSIAALSSTATVAAQAAPNSFDWELVSYPAYEDVHAQVHMTYKDGQTTVDVSVQGGPDVVHSNPDGRSSLTFTAAGVFRSPDACRWWNGPGSISDSTCPLKVLVEPMPKRCTQVICGQPPLSLRRPLAKFTLWAISDSS